MKPLSSLITLLLLLGCTQKDPSSDSIDTLLLGSVNAIREVPTEQEWEASKDHPDAILTKLEKAGAKAEDVCLSLGRLTDEQLTHFEDALKNHGPLIATCKETIVNRLKLYWEKKKEELAKITAQNATPNSLGPTREIFVSPDDFSKWNYDDFGDLKPKEVVLSFDDGPHPTRTFEVLKTLSDNGIHANFFVVGQNIVGQERILRTSYASGHSIGGHSWTHAQLNKLTKEKAIDEIESAQNKILQVLGLNTHLFRFPYGANNKALDTYIAEAHLTSFFWNVDTRDWALKNPTELLEFALKETLDQGRGIILFHDIQNQTAIALPAFLSELRSRGFKTAVIRSTGRPLKGQ